MSYKIDNCLILFNGEKMANSKFIVTSSLSRNNRIMLNWAIAFLILAIIAAVFGFFGIATAAVGIAKILFYIFLVLFVVSLIVDLVRRVDKSV